MKIVRYPDFKKSELKTFILAGDWHSFALNKPTYSILKQILGDIENPILVINGDFVDAPYFMFKQKVFQKWHARGFEGIEEYFIPEVEKEIQWANVILDELQPLCSEIILTIGNHDWRIDQYGHEYAPHAYKSYFNIESLLNLRKRNIRLVGYNNWLDIGKVSITHGMYHGSTCHKKHYEAANGRSVVFSHIHRHELKAFSTRGHTRVSMSLPAMCDLNPQYMKNIENNWSNGFGTLSLYQGFFNLTNLNVWDGRLITPLGELYEGF